MDLKNISYSLAEKGFYFQDLYEGFYNHHKKDIFWGGMTKITYDKSRLYLRLSKLTWVVLYYNRGYTKHKLYSLHYTLKSGIYKNAKDRGEAIREFLTNSHIDFRDQYPIFARGKEVFFLSEPKTAAEFFEDKNTPKESVLDITYNLDLISHLDSLK